MKGIKFKAKPKKNQLDKCLSCWLLNQTYNVRYCLSLYEWQMADNSIIDNVYFAEMPLFFYGVQDKMLWIYQRIKLELFHIWLCNLSWCWNQYFLLE